MPAPLDGSDSVTCPSSWSSAAAAAVRSFDADSSALTVAAPGLRHVATAWITSAVSMQAASDSATMNWKTSAEKGPLPWMHAGWATPLESNSDTRRTRYVCRSEPCAPADWGEGTHTHAQPGGQRKE